ncbi:aminodeoxychorismate synthase component I [Marinactinospora thermotolerans]|uniref:aminodeoxychorismate synthase component I n=1 Tax=Marinactinospora thermotolerans TaxID=531310 RepID=UPI003D918201
MRVLLVDNHDSYTFNLFHLIAEVVGAPPVVVSNDDPRWPDLALDSFDAAVISPGPGHPRNARDVGRIPRLLADPSLPLLGVCLGHQAIAHAAGAEVTAAPTPRHGHRSRVRHDGTDLFAGLPQDFTVVRYHSLCVSEPPPPVLAVTARAEDGVVMGLRHRSLPRWGVQFHPESVDGEYGRALVANFRDLASAARRDGRGTGRARVTETRDDAAETHLSETRSPLLTPLSTPLDLRKSPTRRSETRAAAARPQSVAHRLLAAVDPEAVFGHLYAEREHAFWLDSGLLGETARFSFLGDASGPEGEVLTYRVDEGVVRVRAGDGAEHEEEGTIFDALRRRVARRPQPVPGLPFDFAGGYVGYFGYELKAHCGGVLAHRSAVPDAVWLRCDRLVVVDHVEGRTHLVARGPGATAWIERTAAAIAALPSVPAAPAPDAPLDPQALLERDREGYLVDVKECQARLAAGESYEICLTNRLRLPAPDGDLDFYRRLRRHSPAPYAALLRLGEVSVYSASPERFLRIGPDGVADSRPIKGTAPRHDDPATDARTRDALRTDPKTRAENLMIVDLLRNDLGRVCEVGSVEVPEFMYTRSFATVHQLISTIRGRLRDDVHPVDAVRACFPAGSMTGAPKERTMEIIDALESSARGVYSGALGYLSHNGTADLSVVIRSAVRRGGELEIGAGGAIVLDSDPAQEYAEMLLKAAVPLRGVPGGADAGRAPA